MSDAPKKEGAPEKKPRAPRKKKQNGEGAEGAAASGDAAAPPTVGERGRATTIEADRLQAKTEGGSKEAPEKARKPNNRNKNGKKKKEGEEGDAAAPPTVGERGRATTMEADRLRAKTEGGSKDKPERTKPEPKVPAGPPGALSGEVKWYQRKKGFGFITPADGGEDVFLHLSGLNVSSVDAGEKVTYDTEKDEDGKVKAINVSVVGERKAKPKKRASAEADAAEGGGSGGCGSSGGAAASGDKSADAPSLASKGRVTTMEADRLAAKLDGGGGKEKPDRKDRKDNAVISQMVHLTNFSGRYVKSKAGGDADVAEACIWAQCCPFRRPFWRGGGMGKRVLTINPKMLMGGDATGSSWRLWYVNKTPGNNEKHIFHKMVLAPASHDFKAQGWEAFEGTIELSADDSKLPQAMFDQIRARCPEEEGFFEHLHVGLVIESIDTTLR